MRGTSAALSLICCVPAAASVGPSVPSGEVGCEAAVANDGCSVFCGYEGVRAGNSSVCLPSSLAATRPPNMPFGISPEDQAEVCDLVAAEYGCSVTCGFKVGIKSSVLIGLPGLTPSTQSTNTESVACVPLQWSRNAGQCLHVSELAHEDARGSLRKHGQTRDNDTPIIGGSGKYRYQYMPDRVVAPEGAVMQNCHGM